MSDDQGEKGWERESANQDSIGRIARSPPAGRMRNRLVITGRFPYTWIAEG